MLNADFVKYKKITIEKDAEKNMQINNLQQFQVETQENYEKVKLKTVHVCSRAYRFLWIHLQSYDIQHSAMKKYYFPTL